MDISNTIMQGTVFGSLICTSVVDKLAKIFYGNQDIMYQYKKEVDIPPLGMVDDVLCVSIENKSGLVLCVRDKGKFK